MGKIRTEGVGEVQEFVDIVGDVKPTRARNNWYTVRLWHRIVQNDERQSNRLREARTFDTGRYGVVELKVHCSLIKQLSST